MRLESGDVCIVDFGEEYSGHRQIGIRPALVVRRVADIVVVVPLTSKKKASRFSGTIAIKPDAANGLNRSGVALIFQIQPIDMPEIIKKIGVLSARDKRLVTAAMQTFLVLT